MGVLNRAFLIGCVNRVTIVKKLMKLKETIETLNDSLDGNEEVYSNKFKENPKILILTLLILFCHTLLETIK